MRSVHKSLLIFVEQSYSALLDCLTRVGVMARRKLSNSPKSKKETCAVSLLAIACSCCDYLTHGVSASTPDSDRQPVHFPGWKTALRQSGLPGADVIAYERAILSFLRLCKVRHAPATVVLVRLHLQSHPGHRMALRWFFKAAGWTGTVNLATTATAAISPERADGPTENKRLRSNEPGLAANDLGREPWEPRIASHAVGSPIASHAVGSRIASHAALAIAAH